MCIVTHARAHTHTHTHARACIRTHTIMTPQLFQLLLTCSVNVRGVAILDNKKSVAGLSGGYKGIITHIVYMYHPPLLSTE